ncbi:MAG: hypothetical protein DRR16_28655 [Candidatus Parabeggiatoa sp. nov. 3]|jgi:hypothetical protein|nr:MAG: hypothetical protein DRR00_30060 [Gammaproteobacteria bacterium]RKZ51485.1 MAG: hypothetical protein DRQ99_33155 [Gammaproteobacteria bacterium]RKZ77957.1 MAG: hypothetical protein DRR16_28655 [Gammaproteobacteria bacterium]
MAKKSSLSRSILVIDTSYLLELFRVPGHSEEKAIREIRIRHEQAIKDKAMLFVPLPCIFELGNHIADVRDETRRKALAHFLVQTIQTCVERSTPWTITPPEIVIEDLPKLLAHFANQSVIQCRDGKCMGLVDTSTVHEAQRLKDARKSLGYKVHIWTKDKRLKENEPDPEDNPFLG